ncbi:MAG: hypothetical protein VX581_09815 [Chloroflexota bacterium]|nr:hypothetical protein [Chloroflexota bacterium]
MLQSNIAGSDGRVRLTWTVNNIGSYVATGTAGNFPISGSASVQYRLHPPSSVYTSAGSIPRFLPDRGF